jgi:hypothetical protein
MGDEGAWLTSSADRNAEPIAEREARIDDGGTGFLDVDGMGASSPVTITSTIDDCSDDDGSADRTAEPEMEREARDEGRDVGGWKVNGMGASDPATETSRRGDRLSVDVDVTSTPVPAGGSRDGTELSTLAPEGWAVELMLVGADLR